MAAKLKTAKGKITQSNLLGSHHDRKARFKDDDKESLAFKVLSSDHTKQLLEIDDVDIIQSKLQEILKLSDTSTDLKEGASLDYFVSGFWWAKEQGFNVDQASAHFTILHQMLENVKDKQLPLTESLKEFKKLFAGVGIEHSEISGGLGCFDINQAKQIMAYFEISLFQHYKIYEFVFGTSQAEEIIGTDLTVEVPQPADLPWPAPLEEAVTEEIYNQFIATPPPTPAPKDEVCADGKGDSAVVVGTEGEKSEEEKAAESEHMADLLTQLSADEIKQIMNDTFEEMLGGLKTDVQSKLRLKENDYINRINKVHRTPSAKSSKS